MKLTCMVIRPPEKPRYRLHEVHDAIPELFAVIKDDEDSGRVVA